MTRIISFAVTGEFASFRDPTVTTNQLVYYIPSKTAVVGLIGAILGIKRGNTLDEIYSKEYLEFFSKIKIGIQLCNNPNKITFFTNHRSLKQPKTKPVKKEILESPKYIFYVKSTDDILDSIISCIKNHNYEFSPYLGHAYCIAKISDLKIHDGQILDNLCNTCTDCVILDESDYNYNTSFKIELSKNDNAMLVVERHLHHFFEDSEFKSKVLKHWIPVDATPIDIDQLEQNRLSDFYRIEKKVHCLY